LNKENISLRETPLRDGLSTEAEEYPLPEAVTRQLLVKTLRAGKYSSSVTVICEVWGQALVLKLSVVMSCTLKWSKNAISNRKPRQESLHKA
jgi:hypothetical protein